MKAPLLLGALLLAALPAQARRDVDRPAADVAAQAQDPWKTRAQARAAFEGSWDFYKWRIEQGDSLEELEIILKRIRGKYARARVNHAMVERELGAVQALRALGRPTAVGGE